MFDPIAGPTNHYEGPATGHSTEKGDSWHTAVAKINAGFKAVIGALEAPFSAEGMEIVDTEARKEVTDLRETVAKMQITIDRMAMAAVTGLPSPANTDPSHTMTSPPPVVAAPTEDAAANG